MNDAAPGTQSIVVEYKLASPPEKVWRALTDPELLSAWLMVNDIKPVVGHRFTFKAQPVPGWDGIVHCEVLEVESNRRLVYSWKGGTDSLEGYGSRLDSVVTWVLEPHGTGTLLRLEHSGFTAKNAFAFDAMSKGWRGKVGEKIEQVVSTIT